MRTHRAVMSRGPGAKPHQVRRQENKLRDCARTRHQRRVQDERGGLLLRSQVHGRTAAREWKTGVMCGSLATEPVNRVSLFSSPPFPHSKVFRGSKTGLLHLNSPHARTHFPMPCAYTVLIHFRTTRLHEAQSRLHAHQKSPLARTHLPMLWPYKMICSAGMLMLVRRYCIRRGTHMRPSDLNRHRKGSAACGSRIENSGA